MEGLTKKEDLKEYNPQEEEYCAIVSSLMYLMIGTRPDLASSIGIISRYLANPSEAHLTVAKCILHYVKGTSDYRLTLGPSEGKGLSLYGYTDAD